MKVRVLADPPALGRAAAAQAANLIRAAIAARRTARMIAAAADSQIDFLDALSREPDLAWGEVELFHLGEFVGLPFAHPASQRRFLHQHLIDRVRVGRYHLLNGEFDPERVGREEGAQLAGATVDLACVDLGVNGQLAFNEPPADFQAGTPYAIVRLDERHRRQQIDAGRFEHLAEVPERAISMSVRQILKAAAVIVIVPGAEKADAVRRCLEGAVSPLAPASILQTHPDVTFYLEPASAARLTRQPPVEP